MECRISHQENLSPAETEVLNQVLKKIETKATAILGDSTIRTGGKNKPAAEFFYISACKTEDGHARINVNLSYSKTSAYIRQGQILGWLEGIYDAAHRGTKKTIAGYSGESMQFDSIADLAQAMNTTIPNRSQNIDISDLARTSQARR